MLSISRLIQRQRWRWMKQNFVDLARKSSIFLPYILLVLLITIYGCLPFIPLNCSTQQAREQTEQGPVEETGETQVETQVTEKEPKEQADRIPSQHTETEQEPVKKTQDISRLTPADTSDTQDIGREVQIAMENGDYGRILNDSERRIFFEQHFDQNTKPLKAEIEFHYIRRRIHREVGGSDSVLTKSTPYRLVIKVSESCFIYVFRYDSAGRLHQLFPNKDISNFDNPLRSRVIFLPEAASYQWFQLEDSKLGTETIYLIASRWRQKRLGSLLNKLNKAEAAEDPKNAQQVTDEILALMKEADEYTVRIGGLATTSYSFQHASASSDL